MKSINIKFLSPFRILLIMTSIFIVLLPMLPIDVRFPLSFSAIVFWIICFISFLTGAFLGEGNYVDMPLRRAKNGESSESVKRVIFWLVVIGLVGTILQLIDRFYLRGVSIEMDSLEARSVLESSQSSFFSVIAAFLGSIGLISFMFVLIVEMEGVVIRRIVKISALIGTLVSFYISLKAGSRSQVLIIFITYFFMWIALNRAKGKKISGRKIFLIILLVIFLALGMAWLMVQRVDLMGFSIMDSIMMSTYAFTITPSNSIVNAIQDSSEFAAILGGMFSLLQYVFHGLFEFGLLFDNFSGEHELGNQILWLPAKLLSSLTGGFLSYPVFNNYGVREGVFTTFVGPLWIDFGYLTPVVLLVLGWLLARPFYALKQGKLEWLPSVVIVSTVCVLWPIVNILTSASGMYLITVSIFSAFFLKSLSLKN